MLNKIRFINDRKLFITVGIVILVFLLLPILNIFLSSLGSDSEYISLLKENNLLFNYIYKTLELILKVSIFTFIIGFVLAYIVSIYDFKFRRQLKFLLILPLAIPVYVAAYTYTGIYIDIPILRTIFKNDFTMNGSVFIYVMFLYPYVYLSVRSFLNKNLQTYIEVSKTLGIGPIKRIFKLIIPLSRPIIISAVSFVCFETLSDFAVVEYYNNPTLSRIINMSWVSLGDVESAAKLSIYLLGLLFMLIYIEKLSRYDKSYSDSSIINRSTTKIKPNIMQSIVIYTFISIVLLFSFILPVGSLVIYFIKYFDFNNFLDLIPIIINSLTTILIALIAIIVLSIILASVVRTFKLTIKHLTSSFASIGYAIPSIVLSLGVYVILVKLDAFIFPALRVIGFRQYLFTGTRIALIIGLTVKFFAIAFSNFINTFEKTGDNIFDSGKVLGYNNFRSLKNINLPLLRKTFKSVAVILFIDLIKELTLTMTLRPFNYSTLSTEVYRYASIEELNKAALPSLIIIILCILFIRYLEKGDKYVKDK